MKDLVIFLGENRICLPPLMEDIALKLEPSSICSTRIGLEVDGTNPSAEIALQVDVSGEAHLLRKKQEFVSAELVEAATAADRRPPGWDPQVHIETASLAP
jgi:hypothetical protein